METKTTECELSLPINPESVLKLNVKWIEEEDGSGTIQVEWDETDESLQWWTDLGEKGQQEYLMKALESAIEKTFEESTDDI